MKKYHKFYWLVFKIYITIFLREEVILKGVKVMEDALSNLKVVKRNGKKVDFDSMKIAVAIKKGFDNL